MDLYYAGKIRRNLLKNDVSSVTVCCKPYVEWSRKTLGNKGYDHYRVINFPWVWEVLMAFGLAVKSCILSIVTKSPSSVMTFVTPVEYQLHPRVSYN